MLGLLQGCCQQQSAATLGNDGFTFCKGAFVGLEHSPGAGQSLCAQETFCKSSPLITVFANSEM